jgi:hypothetical protein
VFKINERPAYTDRCKFKEDRSTLCQFRISAHSLEIEKGRYYNIPRENLVCLSCKTGKVEVELHLFLDCPSYAHLRQDFFEKIKSISGEVNQKVFNNCQMIALLKQQFTKTSQYKCQFNKCQMIALLKQQFTNTSQYHCQFNKCQMIALLNRNSPKLLNIIVNFMNKCMSKRNSS